MDTAASRGLPACEPPVPSGLGELHARRTLLLVDQIGNLEIQSEVWLEVLRVASLHCYTVSQPRLSHRNCLSVHMKRCSGEVGASPNAP